MTPEPVSIRKLGFSLGPSWIFHVKLKAFELALNDWITSQEATYLVGDERAKEYVKKALSCGYIGYSASWLV